MYFNQISVNGMGCLSYVIGCPRAKAMAIVDPKRDIQDYLTIAREEGMQNSGQHQHRVRKTAGQLGWHGGGSQRGNHSGGG